MKLTDALAPQRMRGVEYLDDPATPDDVRTRAMADVATSNTLFGGRGAVTSVVRSLLPQLPKSVSVLDVGTGHGEIAAAVRTELTTSGRTARAVGLDLSESVARAGRARLDEAIAGSALNLPIRSASVDLVICSQLLHHFAAPQALAVIAEINRVSRGWVVIADLRRSHAAAAGFWLASIVLGFHPVTRHDGVVSVMRGFTATELESLVRDATGVTPQVRRRPMWRVIATWQARHA